MLNHNEPFLDWDIATLSTLIQNKALSPVEITKKMLDRIYKKNDQVNAYITVTADLAMEQAIQAEKDILLGHYKGILHGVPIALKDNIYTKEATTTMGSEIYKDFLAPYDATVVQKLEAAGSILLGKLNMHEFAYGTTGDRSYFGPAKNSHNHSKIAGGSSSGSGVAVADSLCYAALGTDTGGSIRIPSAFNGIVGMKPTFGRVSNYGVFPLCWSLDHVGPMTKTVYDNALVLNVLSGYDRNDPYSVNMGETDFTKGLEKDLQDIVIGVPSNSYFYVEDEQIKNSHQQAMNTLKQLGCKIELVEIPDLESLSDAFQMVLKCEAYTVHEERLQDYPNKWDEEVKQRLLKAKGMKATDYVQAQQVRQRAIRECSYLMEDIDAMLIPTVPIMPIDIEQREVQFNGEMVHSSSLHNTFTGIFNLLSFPSLSIPSNISASALPIGMQLIGKPFAEEKIYQIASQFEIAMNR